MFLLPLIKLPELKVTVMKTTSRAKQLHFYKIVPKLLTKIWCSNNMRGARV